MTQQSKVRRLVNIALFGALTYVTTRYLRFSLGIGYLHLGDMIVMLASMLLGPVEGALAGALGGGAADLVSGYASFIPFTIVAKALMGITTGFAWKGIKEQKHRFVAIFGGAYVQAQIYFFAYVVLYFNSQSYYGQFLTMSFSNSVADFLQGLIGGLVALPLYGYFSRFSYFASRES